jgi:type II secretory pathway component GspD/PulD (secretin)
MSPRASFILVPFMALTASLALTGARGDETRIIQLKHRTAQDIIPVVRPLIGPDDALSGIDYRLIIRTSDKNFEEINRVLDRLDVAQRRLRITVEQVAAGDRTSVSQSLSGEKRFGDQARITLPAGPSGDRGVVVQNDKLRYSANARSTTTGNADVQTVMTLDGQAAYIRVGQSVPYVTKILGMRRHRPAITQGVALQDVTTGFEVVPHVHGDRVRIDIAPRLATLQDPATGLADFQELSTTVDVRLGEWVDLGAIVGDRDEVGRAVLESAATRSGERRTVRLRIE